MKEYTLNSADNGAGSQLDSMLSQLREKARSAQEWTATVVPIESDAGEPLGLSFTLAVQLPPPAKPHG